MTLAARVRIVFYLAIAITILLAFAGIARQVHPGPARPFTPRNNPRPAGPPPPARPATTTPHPAVTGGTR